MASKRQQRGMTFIGLLVVGGLLAVAGLIAAQVFPTYIEFLAVQKAAKKASAGVTVADVRSIFDKAAQIDDIRSIAGKDLEVGKQGNNVVVSFSYQREIHLAGPAYLVMKYAGSSQ
jgi:predicted transcriptional regulator